MKRVHTIGLQDTDQLVASDVSHLGNAVRVTKDNTDLGRGHSLLGKLANVLIDLSSSGLQPGRRGSSVWECRICNTLTTTVHATHDG